MEQSMYEIPNIKNFELLCDLLKKFNQSSEDDSVWIINEMYEIDGYDEWLDWMEKNRPSELP
jgi:hypothetical protein